MKVGLYRQSNFIIKEGIPIKRNSLKPGGWLRVTLALAVIIVSLVESAQCQVDNAVLLLEQTPIQGGQINLGLGVHRLNLNSEVTLTATPKPGYQFVYWMGDVSDSTSNSTVVLLNSPKIVIAVFERTEYDFLFKEGLTESSPGGGLYAHAADYSRGGESAVIVRRPPKYSWPTPPEDPEPKDFPVPEPIPEPATGVLLLIGSFFASVRRLQRNRINKNSA